MDGLLRVIQEFQITPDAAKALAPALRRSNMTWPEIDGYMRGEGCCVWNIGGVGYVLTLVNRENEIEVLLAGGERAKECVPHWEAAMHAHPAHKGMTIRVDGRKGWQRLLYDWEIEGGILSKKVA